MKLSLANKVLLVISYGFIPLGLVCLWGAFWWTNAGGGFLGLNLILFLLAVVFPAIGYLNVRRILEEKRKDDADI